MSDSQPSNQELVRLLEPWFPLFVRVGAASERDFLAAIPLLGPPRKTERAGDLHRAFRTNFQKACDLGADPLLAVRQEPEGQGLDYLLCNLNPDLPFILRWGRFDGERVRRNRTDRNKQIQQQSMMFASMEPDAADMPMITLGHTIEDEYTEAGRSCLWIGKLLLLRERKAGSEVVTEVHVYTPPQRESGRTEDVPSPIVSARNNEAEEWEKIIRRIRSA